jgi:DNA topoisomerase I
MFSSPGQLHLVHDFEPGLTREGSPGRFAYRTPSGESLQSQEALARIDALAIPPAWRDVWISPDPDSHLQATGIDSRGRKQYRYHPAWRHDRDELKFHDMEAFARAQPRLRKRVERDLGRDAALSHRQVLALALRLLDVGLFRVGSDRYARDNRHYGLTTLLVDQVTVGAGQAVFDYVGKAGKRHRLAIADPQSLPVLRTLSRRRSGPEELLAFRSAAGWKRVHREDVNNFLRAESGGPFSAKEYRTWNATVIAAATLSAQRPGVRRAPVIAAKAVSEALGNTPTVARQSYIDPRVFDRYASGRLIDLDRLPADAWNARRRIESRVLELLDAVDPRARTQ